MNKIIISFSNYVEIIIQHEELVDISDLLEEYGVDGNPMSGYYMGMYGVVVNQAKMVEWLDGIAKINAMMPDDWVDYTLMNMELKNKLDKKYGCRD